MMNIIRLSIVLAIVTLIAAFVLAEIYSVTKPQIELQKLAKTREALRIVLPDAKLILANTNKIPVRDSKGNTLYEKDVIDFYTAYGNTDTSTIIGYAFKAEGNGYSSLIETMVGVDTIGKIGHIKIISQKETPGLGDLAENDEPFTGRKWSTRQFRNKTIEDLKVDKDGGDIVSITGATITSRTITNSIRDELKEMLSKINTPEKPDMEN